jgi:NitT/TauT family transport system substrate-binding protein
VPSSFVSRRRFTTGLAALAITTVGLAGCGSGDDEASADGGGGGGGGGGVEVHLGYFPNLTHAPALIGVHEGLFEDELDKIGSTVQTQTFDSGSDTIEQLLGGSLDATYIGPSPTLTAYAQSHGEAVRVVSGVTSGGASLVAQPEITSVDQLEGKTVATPGLANTQDIAARAYFKEQGFETDVEGGGDVSVLPQDNSITVQQFQQGKLDAAWVPEPYASILVAAGGKVLVDEATLWPDGQFVTTQILVRTDFLEEHPEEVKALLAANDAAVAMTTEDPDNAKSIASDQLKELTSAALPPEVLNSAWDKLTFTNDPLAATLEQDYENASDLGLIESIDDLAGLYDLDIVNELLKDEGQEEVAGL